MCGISIFTLPTSAVPAVYLAATACHVFSWSPALVEATPILAVYSTLVQLFKGIVSRDFRCLQMILMNRTWVPDVPLEVYSFLNLHLHIVF